MQGFSSVRAYCDVGDKGITMIFIRELSPTEFVNSEHPETPRNLTSERLESASCPKPHFGSSEKCVSEY